MFKNLSLIEMVDSLAEKEYDLPILSETYKKCSEIYEACFIMIINKKIC